MSTTTIRLPDELKSRIEQLAAASGGSAHAFMLDAIAEATVQQERRNAFAAEAERRYQRMQRTGEYLTHQDLRTYAMALAHGERPARPTPHAMTPEELAEFRARARRAGPT